MLDQLKNRIFRLNKIAGLELQIEADGSVMYNLVLLEKRKSLVITTFKQINIASPEELAGLIPKDVPVALTISGKGVLFKKASGNLEGSSLLEQILPNAMPDDLYISSVKNIQQYVFLARKDRVDTHIKVLEEKGIQVVNISVGVSQIVPLLPFLSSELREIESGGFQIQLLNGNLQDINPVGKDYKSIEIEVGDERIPVQLLPAFGAAFNVLALGNEPEDTTIRKRFDTWKEKAVFQEAGKVLLIFFASLLFINLALFFYLSGENSELGAKNSTVLADIRKVESLEAELKQKEKFLQEAGWIASSKTSLYADQIAATVPNTILLTELSIHPNNLSESRKEKRMIFETGKILIAGTCKDPVVLNPWLVELKKLDWVESAASKKYQYDHKKKIGFFELELLTTSTEINPEK